MHSNPNSRRALALASAAMAVAAFLSPGASLAQQPEKVKAAITTEMGTHREAAQSQQRIDKLDDQTQEMLLDYRATIRETDSLRRYNEQLERQIRSQIEEIESIQTELTQIEETNREVLPMMLRMVDTLEKFVELDLPFLMEERTERVNNLKDIMDRADVTTSEKYRRILDAYKVELDYGRNIETYEASVKSGGGSKTVNFLRIGRVALLYQTKDELETAVYNRETGNWDVVNEYTDSVKKGLRIAGKQAAPDLMILPIDAPQEAK